MDNGCIGPLRECTLGCRDSNVLKLAQCSHAGDIDRLPNPKRPNPKPRTPKPLALTPKPLTESPLVDSSFGLSG